VYQSAPSGVASGSCGRAPGVGTSHSRNETCTGPAITTGPGLAFVGKLSIRYRATVAFSASDNRAPAATIMLTTLRHSAAV
jgi:hypothetical protein